MGNIANNNSLLNDVVASESADRMKSSEAFVSSVSTQPIEPIDTCDDAVAVVRTYMQTDQQTN